MNTRQSNKLASYAAVEAVLKATPEVADISGLPEKLAVLSAKTGEINSLATTQTQPIRASMTERDLVLEEMADKAVEIAGLITSLARDTNVPQLAEAVEFGRTFFRRARRSHRLWFGQRVLDTARSVLPQLAPYGVTAETLTAFEGQIEAARSALNLPRNTAVEKKAATSQLAGLFREIDRLLGDQIDRLVFRLRKTNAAFDAKYEHARAIVDHRGGRRALSPDVQKAPASTPAPSIASTPPAPTATSVEQERAA